MSAIHSGVQINREFPDFVFLLSCGCPSPWSPHDCASAPRTVRRLIRTKQLTARRIGEDG